MARFLRASEIESLNFLVQGNHICIDEVYIQPKSEVQSRNTSREEKRREH
jgi:hypothetical protein